MSWETSSWNLGGFYRDFYRDFFKEFYRMGVIIRIVWGFSRDGTRIIEGFYRAFVVVVGSIGGYRDLSGFLFGCTWIYMDYDIMIDNDL